MLCTQQARNSLWAWSPCLAHGQHFHLPVRLQSLLSWRQLHLPLPVFLRWQNTSGKLIRSILPDATQNSQASHCFLKRLCPTANPAPPQNSISWKGKYMHGIFGRVHNRKKSLDTYFISKAQSTWQGVKKKKKIHKTRDGSVWVQAQQSAWTWLYHWGLFFFFSTRCVVKQLLKSVLLFF